MTDEVAWQVTFLRYDGFGTQADSSGWKRAERRLSDGSWWRIYWWYPPRQPWETAA